MSMEVNVSLEVNGVKKEHGYEKVLSYETCSSLIRDFVFSYTGSKGRSGPSGFPHRVNFKFYPTEKETFEGVNKKCKQDNISFTQERFNEVTEKMLREDKLFKLFSGKAYHYEVL